MATDYLRRQNTDGWWKLSINRIIDDGNRIKAFNSFNSFQDLLDFKDRTDNWLKEAKQEVSRIYQGAIVADRHCCPVGNIDLEKMSWSDAVNLLKSIIDERIQRFMELISSTT